MQVRFFFLVFVLSTRYSFAQNSETSFSKLSGPEKFWVITHPFVANKARKLTNEALQVSNEMKNDRELDGDAAGGQVDAFRHAYWMARLAQHMCLKKARSLGRAHEKANRKKFDKGLVLEEGIRQDSVYGAMDLYNNNIGSCFGCEFPKLNNDSLKMIIKKAVLEGKMKIIFKNLAGVPLDTLGIPIDFSKLKNDWRGPEILVNSNRSRPE